MKKKSITLLNLILVLCVLTALCSCTQSDSGREIHTMFPGDGLTEPETVIVTLPAETVIVTVPVEVTSAPETQAPETQAAVTTAEVTTSAPESAVAPEYGYTVINETRNLGKDSTANFIYPALQNTGNTQTEEKVNDLLKSLCEGDFTGNENCKDYADKIASNITVTYTVTACDVKLCTPYYMSVRSEAQYTLSDSSDIYTFIYTHLINLSTGKEVKTKNIFSDFGAILDLLESNRMTKGASTQGFDSLIDMESTIKQYRSSIAYGVGLPKVYFTSDSLYIIVELDQKLGGWGEYSVPLEKVKSYLKISL